MKIISYASVLIVPLILAGCIEEFTPSTVESKFNLVVDGLITNQREVYTVKLSWSIPFGIWTKVPLEGCDVTVHDDLGHIYQLYETSTPGTYISDSSTFQGVAGRKYTLRINTNSATPKHYSYESVPVEMKAVPPIDSLYYEKVIIKEATPTSMAWEGCQIFLNTNDPDGNCRYYKWDYTETWKIQLPGEYDRFAINSECWISNYSGNDINIKNTLGFSENRIYRHPLTFISNMTDRLSVRYSLLVNQYSLSENEFAYWEKIKNVAQDLGNLWDIIPYSITGNMFCVEDPGEQVFGWFSASAKTSKRIYIEDRFEGLVDRYLVCPMDTFPSIDKIPGLNQYQWILKTVGDDYVTTYNKECVDCTERGTTTRPEFWEDFE